MNKTDQDRYRKKTMAFKTEQNRYRAKTKLLSKKGSSSLPSWQTAEIPKDK
jgi:hypothetical protein